jgi:iron(III) transport system permease protein
MDVVKKDVGVLDSRRLNRIRRRVLSPQFILTILLLIALGYLILVPLFSLIRETLVWGEGDHRLSPEAVPGEYTLAHWKRVLTGGLSEKLLLQPLGHTLITGIITSILSLLIGGVLAWLVTRTNLPARGTLRTLLILPYLLPSFALALAWTTTFKSELVGGRPGVFEILFGIPPPEWLSFGPIPMIIAMTVHYYPFTFLIVSGALSTLDAQLEEGAELLGASRWTILRRITFPLVTPAFLSAWVLTLGKAVSAFATPVLLGLPVRYHTLSTMLFSNIGLGLTSNGYILALVLITIASLTVYFNSRLLGASARYVTIGGKGFKANPVRLGRWRIPIFGLLILIILAWVAVPIGLLAYQSVMLIDGVYSLDNFTTYFWVGETDVTVFPDGEPGVLANDSILGAIWNSLRLAISGAVLGSLLGVLVGYLVVRSKNKRLAGLLDQVSFLPYLIPGIALGAMYLSLFAVRRGPVPALYGTFTLLVVISIIKRLPYTTRTGSSAITQIGIELEEAAELQGASWINRFRRIVIPLASSGVMSGMMITYITIMRELSLIIILITPATRVLMTMSYRYVEEDYIQHGNTLVLIVIILTLIGEIIAWRLGRGRLAARLAESE